MNERIHGPFVFIESEPGEWSMNYKMQCLGTRRSSDLIAPRRRRVPQSGPTLQQLVTAFEVDRRAYIESQAAQYMQEPGWPFAWIRNLLSADVLSSQPTVWRAPTSWEVAHLVGLGSFTSKTVNDAAQLVGVTDTNFYRYLSTGISGLKMSYSMWHLLLHRMGVQSA